jgi:hypothetical protein
MRSRTAPSAGYQPRSIGACNMAMGVAVAYMFVDMA